MADCVGYFYVSLTQDRVILGKRTSIEKMTLLDLPVGKLMVNFLDWHLMCEGTDYWGHWHLKIDGPGCFKKASRAIHGQQANNSTPLEFLPRFPSAMD